MQPIPLRSTEPVKRIAIEEVRPLLPEDWGHGRILDVTAALFGYDNWAHLHQSPQASAPSIVFDQDMSYAEYSTRRVEVAKHVESRCAIPFPYAFALATIAAVTRDFRRKAVATYAREHAVFQEEMATRDWWRVGSLDYFHPLVTKGFVLGEATYAADIAEDLLGRLRQHRTISVLLFEDMVETPYKRFISSLYFKINEILRVEPPPFAEMLNPSYRPGERDIAHLKEMFGGGNWAKRIELAQRNYTELRARAMHSLSDYEAVDIRARDALKKPWYWPLKTTAGQLHIEQLYERLERAKWT